MCKTTAKTKPAKGRVTEQKEQKRGNNARSFRSRNEGKNDRKTWKEAMGKPKGGNKSTRLAAPKR